MTLKTWLLGLSVWLVPAILFGGAAFCFDPSVVWAIFSVIFFSLAITWCNMLIYVGKKL